MANRAFQVPKNTEREVLLAKLAEWKTQGINNTYDIRRSIKKHNVGVRKGFECSHTPTITAQSANLLRSEKYSTINMLDLIGLEKQKDSNYNEIILASTQDQLTTINDFFNYAT